MEAARTLEATGCNCISYSVFPNVRFMGLYDPVDMNPCWGWSETIPCNVQNAFVVFAAFLIGSGWPANMTGGPPGGPPGSVLPTSCVVVIDASKDEL